jgi:hypothetical protein
MKGDHMTTQAPAADQRFAVPATGERLDRAAAALTERGFTVHVLDSAADARALMLELLPRDKEIFTARSATLSLSGIADDVDESGEFRSIRKRTPDLAENPRAHIHRSAAPDVVLGSVHAITEDGVLLVASASGSQLGPYAAGAERVFWVVGAQKVVPDLDTALRRIRGYSLPRESERLQAAFGQNSFIGKILIIEREAFPGRGTVVLIREPIGF